MQNARRPTARPRAEARTRREGKKPDNTSRGNKSRGRPGTTPAAPPAQAHGSQSKTANQASSKKRDVPNSNTQRGKQQQQPATHAINRWQPFYNHPSTRATVHSTATRTASAQGPPEPRQPPNQSTSNTRPPTNTTSTHATTTTTSATMPRRATLGITNLTDTHHTHPNPRRKNTCNPSAHTSKPQPTTPK